VQIAIVNADLEAWGEPVIPGWPEVGDADALKLEWKEIGQGAHSGHYYLNLWKDAAYQVTTSQLIASVPNGSYSLSVWHQGGGYIEQYLYATKHDSSDTTLKVTKATAASDPWEQIVLSPVVVTNGQIEIGIFSNGATRNWSHFDDFTLTKLP
jgi:hypothetical protein